MAIYIDEQKKLFTLSTNNTSYQMMADKYLVLNHLYYGENIGQEDMSYLLDYQDRGFSGNPYEAGNERDYSLDSRPQEYSTNESPLIRSRFMEAAFVSTIASVP